MKAISLWQPWASLIAIGAKTIETRSWHPGEGLIDKRIYIHAAKRWTQEHADTCCLEPFSMVLEDYFGLHAEDAPSFREVLPFGALVAKARLRLAVPTTMCYTVPWLRTGYHVIRDASDHIDWVEISVQETEFGDYGPGRWAWLLEEIEPLPQPVPATGRQQFFEVTL